MSPEEQKIVNMKNKANKTDSKEFKKKKRKKPMFDHIFNKDNPWLLRNRFPVT